jgi:hypothetical protein
MKIRTRIGPSVRVGAVVWSYLFLCAGIAGAELQRVEAVGIYGIREAVRSRVIPRDEAVARARWEGVSRVALEIIGESAPSDAAGDDGDSDLPSRSDTVARPLDGSGPGGGRFGDPTDPGANPEDREAELRKALGKDLLPYIRSYRIVEDRGEVPVLFDESPDVKVEYVVVVEVTVDVDRVTRSLENAGLIARVDAAAAGEPVIVELVGLSRYEALDTVLKALRERLGATHVQTIEFTPERQVLSVDVPYGPDVLSARLAGFESEQILLEPLGVDMERRRIRMLGRWFPMAAPAEGPKNTSPRSPRG